MTLTFRTLLRKYNYIHNLTTPVKWSVPLNGPIRMLSSGICYNSANIQRPPAEAYRPRLFFISLRECTTQSGSDVPKSPQEPVKKPGLIQRFKEMYRDYWYVLLPVHMTTSAIWLGSFYYLVRSGVDVIALMQSLGISEALLKPLKESSAGYFALTFALYKLVTPLRYAVTVGGTTYAIKKLTTIGWIRPVPSRERIKEILQEKKDNLQDRFNESKQHYQTQMQEKRTQVMDEMKRYKTEMRNMKNKVKKM